MRNFYTEKSAEEMRVDLHKWLNAENEASTGDSNVGTEKGRDAETIEPTLDDIVNEVTEPVVTKSKSVPPPSPAATKKEKKPVVVEDDKEIDLDEAFDSLMDD